MGIRMSIARCCCNVVVVPFAAACRAWNTEGSYVYDKMPTVTGTMPSGTTNNYVSATEPYEKHNCSIVRTNSFGSCNSEIEINPISGGGGFKMVAKGLSSQAAANFGVNEAKVILNGDSVVSGVSGQVERRYDNQFSFPKQARDLVMETTINITSLPSYYTSSSYTQYGLVNFERGRVASFGIDSSGYLCYNDVVESSSSTFYFNRLTVSGVDVAVTAPFSITLRKPSNDNGTVDPVSGSPNYDFKILVDGVLTDQTFENHPRNCQFSDIGWTAKLLPPHVGFFGGITPLTTSDMTIEVSSVDYLIGSGESVVSTPTFTADSPWTVSAGTITCDNTLVTTSIGGLNFPNVSKDKKATATATLTNDTLHRIKFICAAIDPIPVSPENATDTQPVVSVDGTIISATRSAQTDDENRETEEYFFTSAGSGDTTLEFFGFKETKYTISGIEIYKIPA